MTTPRVTVVIPTYNRAGLLRYAIESVLSQTLTELELFVSDNASKDETAAVVASFDDPRVTYAPLPENQGPHANFTRTLRLGTAPFVAPLQDDDLMLPRNLERKVELLERHDDVVLVHSAFRYIGDDGTPVDEHVHWTAHEDDVVEDGRAFLGRSLGRGSEILFSAAVIRRTMAEGIEFAKEDGGPCDLGVWLRLALRGDIAYLVEPLVANRVHRASYTMSSGEFAFADDVGKYRPTFEVVGSVKRVKERFFDECGHLLDDPDADRKRAAAYTRTTLRNIVGRNARPDRLLHDTLRLLREAARTEPSLLRDPRTLRFLGGTLLRSRQVGGTRATT